MPEPSRDRRRRLAFVALAILLSIGSSRRAAAATNDLLGLLRDQVTKADRLFLRVQPITAYGSARQALASPVPYSVEIPITMPKEGRLRFGIAVRDSFLREDLVGRADPVHFTLTFVRPAGEPVFLADRLSKDKGRVLG